MSSTAGHTPRPIPRAEAVGSLLRPAQIADQMLKIYSGQTTSARGIVLPEMATEIAKLNHLADEAIPDLIQRQIDAGLDIVNDGEVRRSTFLSSFFDGLDGISAADEKTIVRDDDGSILYEAFADPVVVGRVHKRANPLVDEIAYMRAVTDHPFKITVPAPSYWFSDIFVVRTGDGYAHRHDFVQDALAITKELVTEAIAAGAKWIQYDFPMYPGIVDDNQAEWIKSLGETPETLLEKCIAVDIDVLQSVPDEVTTAMHLCRGNLEGGLWNGALDPIAEAMFSRLPYDRFLFEWEDVQREGSYEPIKHLPKDKIMAMGLVSTKTPEVESADDIKSRLEEASAFLDIDQLAISPQCGFASLYHDKLVSAEDAQWRKLELVGAVADAVWGRS